MFKQPDATKTSGVPSGLQMMLKMAGFSPEKLEAMALGAKAEAERVVNHFDAKLDSILLRTTPLPELTATINTAYQLSLTNSQQIQHLTVVVKSLQEKLDLVLSGMGREQTPDQTERDKTNDTDGGGTSRTDNLTPGPAVAVERDPRITAEIAWDAAARVLSESGIPNGPTGQFFERFSDDVKGG